MKTTLFALISFLVGDFLSAQTPSPPPTSKIPPKIPVRDFFRNPVSRGYDLSRLNVPTVEMKLAAQSPGNIDRYIADHAGKIRAAITTDGVNTSLLTRPDESAEFKTVLTTNFRQQCAPQFYTFDNKAIYASSNIDRDKSAIVVIDPETAKETQLVYENPEVDVDSVAFSKKRKVLTFAAFDTWKLQRHFFDPETESIYKTLSDKLPGYEIDVA